MNCNVDLKKIELYSHFVLIQSGLKSINNFVGSMRDAYFGTVSILERLRYKDRSAEFHG